jgi:hypothetical protein
VEHERVVAPQQTRAIDAQLQIGPAFFRLSGVPKVFHRAGCIEQMRGELPIAKAMLFGLWIDTVSFVTGYILG